MPLIPGQLKQIEYSKNYNTHLTTESKHVYHIRGVDGIYGQYTRNKTHKHTLTLRCTSSPLCDAYMTIECPSNPTSKLGLTIFGAFILTQIQRLYSVSSTFPPMTTSIIYRTMLRQMHVNLSISKSIHVFMVARKRSVTLPRHLQNSKRNMGQIVTWH